MSGSNRTKLARHRKRSTGESYSHAFEEMHRWRDGDPVIPPATDAAQQLAESAVLHRLLLGARAQWPTDVAPKYPLFVSAVYLTMSGPRLQVPIGQGHAFGAALTARWSSDAGQPMADAIVVGCSSSDSSSLVVKHSPKGGQIDVRCHWNDFQRALDADPFVSKLPGKKLRFAGHRHQMPIEERAVFSSLFRRIGLFFYDEPLAWLFAWHEWMTRGRPGPSPALPDDLALILADARLGLPLAQLAVLGIGGVSVVPASSTLGRPLADEGLLSAQESIAAEPGEIDVAEVSVGVDQQSGTGRRYNRLAVTALRFAAEHPVEGDLYVLRMPARWRQVLEDVRVSASGDLRVRRRSPLDQALELLLPGCVAAAPDAAGASEQDWLYAERPVDSGTVLNAVTAWIRAQPVSAQWFLSPSGCAGGRRLVFA